jgi:archaellum biogenesis ATPase FlaH
MTRQQFIEEIKQLSVAERIALIEAITRSLREDLEIEQSANSISATSNSEIADDSERERKIAAVRRLRGIAKSEGEPPSDEELKEDYVNYLSEKYS